MAMKEAIRLEMQGLIDLAERIGPEAEGVDLTDRDYEFEDMAMLRSRFATMRRAIDIVNKGLAKAWHDKDPKGFYEDEQMKYWLGFSKKQQWQDPEVSPEGFASWLKEQDVETIAAIVPAYGVRIGKVDPVARATFFDEVKGSAQATIQSKPL